MSRINVLSKSRRDFTTALAMRFAYAFMAIGLVLWLSPLVGAQSQPAHEAPKLPEVLVLKNKIRALEEQVFQFQTQADQCSVQLANVRIQIKAGELAAARQASNAEIIKALGGDPAKDDLDVEKLALKPKGTP